MPTPPTDVIIRWLPLEECRDWERLEPLLDADERQRAARFRFAADRHAFIAAHALVRTVLSVATPAMAPAAWRFTATDHGRPEIAPALAEQAGIPALRFNLTHTRRLVAVAVCRGHDVGLDTEDATRETLTMDLAARFFAPAEVAQAAALPPAPRREALYAFWTLKEAYIKAVGLGLSVPLDAFAFTLAPVMTDPPTISFTPRHPGDPAEWLFRRFRPLPDHPMALALRHPAPDRVRVSCDRATADTFPAG